MGNSWYKRKKLELGEKFLENRREIKKAWRAEGNDKNRKKPRGLKANLCHGARARGRAKGLEATITVTDLYWPTHCPVLGIELDYSTPRGQRKSCAGNLPSLDRRDNDLGYVPGNVFVISYRANAIKGNATVDELLAIADYAQHGPM